MKDLFVLTADADAEALMRAVLRRQNDLQIRPIDFDIRRFPGRDSGMVREGPEIARVQVRKAEYSRLLLTWDHHGSGWESRSAESAVTKIQERLDGVTWTGRSSTVVMVPELEEWLWHCPRSLATHLNVSRQEFDALVERAAAKISKPIDRCRRNFPKELFEIVIYNRTRRQPLPEDFRAIASLANLTEWQASETFSRLTRVLREWFPPD